LFCVPARPAAYRAALEEETRERVPLDWSMALNNLGDVRSGGLASGRAALNG
jgi:hypothetical protein